MNHFIEVKEIEFQELAEAGLNDNYPDSGLYLVRTKKSSDLRFIDKSVLSNHCICPESVYKGLGLDTPELPKQEAITNMSTFITTPPGYVSEMFVLDFAKLLLTSKK